MNKEQLVAFLKKHPISVGCAVLSLALGVVIYFRSDAIPEKEAELTVKATEADRHELNIKNSKDLKEQYDALVAANKEVDARLLRASNLGGNVQYFFKLESITGVKLIDPRQTGQTPPKGAAKFTAISFTIAAQGDMKQLMNFLNQLESGEHYCRVLTANLALNGVKRDAPLTLSVTLELLGLP